MKANTHTYNIPTDLGTSNEADGVLHGAIFDEAVAHLLRGYSDLLSPALPPEDEV
jgi:hypothetical protein